jgi:hypothetical protein
MVLSYQGSEPNKKEGLRSFAGRCFGDGGGTGAVGRLHHFQGGVRGPLVAAAASHLRDVLANADSSAFNAKTARAGARQAFGTLAGYKTLRYHGFQNHIGRIGLLHLSLQAFVFDGESIVKDSLPVKERFTKAMSGRKKAALGGWWVVWRWLGALRHWQRVCTVLPIR